MRGEFSQESCVVAFILSGSLKQAGCVCQVVESLSVPSADI